MDHMMLVLTRSAAQQSALDTLLAQQQDKSSPNYHKWLTPEQFGQQFGPSEQDVQTVTSWLQSQGFQGAKVSNGRTLIDFSGTAGQVQQAFHTAIHRYVMTDGVATLGERERSANSHGADSGSRRREFAQQLPEETHASPLGVFRRSNATGKIPHA